MTDELRALADEWARELTTKRGLTLLDVERFAPVLVECARAHVRRIRSGTGEAGSKRKGKGRR